jgi:uncharacterized protein (UPF0261 family)
MTPGTAATETGRLIAASVGETTEPCVDEAGRLLEEAGYTVRMFAIEEGAGAEMERLIANGAVAGVLDLTLADWADAVLGGVLAAGPGRLEAAARSGTPAVLAPGGLDSVRFGPRETLPPQYGRRKLYAPTPDRTLMRTDVSENARLGRLLAETINQSVGPVALCLPIRGFSSLSAPGQPFRWMEADMAFVGNLTTHLRRDIPCYDVPIDLNDPAFARACVETLRALLEEIGR